MAARKKTKKQLAAEWQAKLADIMSGGKPLPSRPAPFEPPRDLPWANSYANWCAHLSVAAAKHGSRIVHGPETYEAWRAGVEPLEYARARGKR